MNEYDSNRILDLTKKINYFVTTNVKEANCYVLNTCHIREKATDKVYHDIGRLKKNLETKKNQLFNSWLCSSSRGRYIIKKRKIYRRSYWTAVVSSN